MGDSFRSSLATAGLWNYMVPLVNLEILTLTFNYSTNNVLSMFSIFPGMTYFSVLFSQFNLSWVWALGKVFHYIFLGEYLSGARAEAFLSNWGRSSIRRTDGGGNLYKDYSDGGFNEVSPVRGITGNQTRLLRFNEYSPSSCMRIKNIFLCRCLNRWLTEKLNIYPLKCVPCLTSIAL